MKEKIRLAVVAYTALFVVVFVASGLICVKITGGLPQKLLKVNWDDSVGKCIPDLPYDNDAGHKFDLYIPADAGREESRHLILFIHGGSFNSGSKEDGENWCKYYTSKGYVTATMDYTLQKHGVDANLNMLNEQVGRCVSAIKENCEELGYPITSMATCGVSAGGTLAMNYAYKNAKTSAIPVAFVFQLAGPSDFEPSDWSLLKKVNRINSDTAFLKWMTGVDVTEEMLRSGEYEQYVKEISPARLINADTVPSLIGYGLHDHVVPASSRTLLLEALRNSGAPYDYVEFPHSNHGMYADLDQLQMFLDLSLEYCNRYFEIK